MRYQITDGTVSLGGQVILSHIDFEIKGNERAAVVGPNGSGKTTFLRLIEGKISLDRDDKRKGKGITSSRSLRIEALHQQAFSDGERTVEEELLEACPCRDTFDRERFVYEQEYDRLFTGFGFEKRDKRRKISSFSGGEQTKIALIRLLLQKPDILLLDEPTNHLDIKYQLQLLDIVKQLDVTVISAIHDLNIAAMYCDYLYAMKDGVIVDAGKPLEILSSELVKTLYEVDAEVTRDRFGLAHVTYYPKHILEGMV